MQETYLNAWKNISSLSEPAKMRSWLFAILRNQWSKLLRSENRGNVTLDHADSLVAPLTDSPNYAGDLIQESIARLDDKFKLPLLLVAMEGLSVEEAADVLAIPRGTVLSRLHRGREKLRAMLIVDPDICSQ